MTSIRGESLENSALTGEVEKSRQQKPTFKKGNSKMPKRNDSDPKIPIVWFQ